MESKQSWRIVTYFLVGLISYFYQPTWYVDNFYLKADFIESIPFKIYYWEIQIIYVLFSILLAMTTIKFIKKNM